MSKNPEENTSLGVSFLLKILAEKFHKIFRKAPVPEPRF